MLKLPIYQLYELLKPFLNSNYLLQGVLRVDRTNVFMFVFLHLPNDIKPNKHSEVTIRELDNEFLKEGKYLDIKTYVCLVDVKNASLLEGPIMLDGVLFFPFTENSVMYWAYYSSESHTYKSIPVLNTKDIEKSEVRYDFHPYLDQYINSLVKSDA